MLTIRKKRKKLFSLLFVFFSFLLFLPGDAQAKVMINEFSSTTDPEWVELYNPDSVDVDLSGWRLEDGNSLESDDLTLEGCLSPGSFRTFANLEGKYWLNNDQDQVILKDETGGEIDKISYGSGGEIPAPPVDKSVTRDPDGGARWQISEPSARDDPCLLELSPTSIFPLEPSATSLPIQTSLESTCTPTTQPTATCQINQPLDHQNQPISQVKVYLDGVYLHHYAPETLTFGESLSCDNLVNCGFGEHTIKLEKKGYAIFEEKFLFAQGSYFSLDPVLVVSLESETPTPSPTLSEVILSPTVTPTPKPILISAHTAQTGSEKISRSNLLGDNQLVLGERDTPQASKTSAVFPEQKREFWPFVLIGSGLLSLGLAGFLLKFKKK
ncbi:lamin tail domain-containing protein [Patescibacteria group bacterium]